MRALILATVSSLLVAWATPGQAQLAPAPAATGTAPTAAPLSAGGLAPPPAVEAAPAPSDAPAPGSATPESTEQTLARADREDSGRGLEFVWLNGEVGVIHLGTGTFGHSHLLDKTDVRTKQTGLLAGAGVGVRLIFFTIGARFRYSPLPDLKLWTLGLEGGAHWPLGDLEPYVTLGAGYASLGSFPGASSLIAKVTGVDARLGAGVDYYLTNMFSVGANIGGDMLFLSRGTTACPSGGSPSFAATYCASGHATAGAVTATAVGGLHF